MIQILIYFFIAISLSMDAFSMSLSLGTISIKMNLIIKIALIIGIFHFFMPIIGYLLGTLISNKIIFGINYFTSLLFIVLAIEMYINKDSEEDNKILNNLTILLIAISVSIDSLTVGIAFGLNKELIILPSIIFLVVSSLFVFIGLNLGKKIKDKYQDKAIYLGIILLIIVSIKYLIFN